MTKMEGELSDQVMLVLTICMIAAGSLCFCCLGNCALIALRRWIEEREEAARERVNFDVEESDENWDDDQRRIH